MSNWNSGNVTQVVFDYFTVRTGDPNNIMIDGVAFNETTPDLHPHWHTSGM